MKIPNAIHKFVLHKKEDAYCIINVVKDSFSLVYS